MKGDDKMSILSGFRKQKRYATDEKGRHQLISTWTHTDTVYDDEGKSLTEIIEDLPAADKKVQQTATDSTNANYEILFSESADNVTKSEEARKSSRLLYNPGTKKLSLAGSKLAVTGSNNGTTEVGGGSMTISRNNNLMEPQLSIYNEHSGGEALLRSNNIQIRDDYTSPTKVMEIQQEDIVLTGGTWDGTNTSLKSAVSASTSDVNVTQTEIATPSSSTNYEILFSGSADAQTHTEGANKSSSLKYDAFDHKIQVSVPNASASMKPSEIQVSNSSGNATQISANNVTTLHQGMSITMSYDDIVTSLGNTWDGSHTSLKAALANAGSGNILSGLSAPTSQQGTNGDLYVRLRALNPYLENFTVDYGSESSRIIDTELITDNLSDCNVYIKQYQEVAGVETLIYEYDDTIDLGNITSIYIRDENNDPLCTLYSMGGAGMPRTLQIQKDNDNDKLVMTVVDATATADAIDTIYIKDNGEWLIDDGDIPSPTASDVGKVLKATDVGEYDWGAAPDPLPSVTSVDNGKVLKVVEGEWAAGADEGGSEAVYKTLAEYEALPTADKEDPTKIYFVINEGSKVSPTLDADDGNISVSSTDGNRAPWHAFSGTTRSDASAHQYCWAPWGQNNGEWIAYSFSSQQQFSKVRFRTCQEGATADTTLKYYVEGSNDGTTWNNLLLNKEYESIVMPKADNTTSPIVLHFVDFNFLLDTTLPTYSKIRVRVDKSIGYPYSYNRWDVANFDIYAANTSAIPMIYYKDVLYNPLVKELPDTLVADAGKALIVNSEGEWDKGNIPTTNSVQVPPVIFDNNKLMKIADMTGFPELEKVFVTSEEYAQLTTAQKQDLSKIYYVSPYKFYTLKDGEITIRVNGTTYEWFFNGFILTENFYTIPSEYRQYTKNDPYEGSTAWSDNTSSTSLGIIEMGPSGYTERISAQDGNWGGNVILNTPIYGKVVIGNGDSQGNSYSDPYDVETPILIYYGGKQYTEYAAPSVYRELTQAEYDALPSSKNSDGIIYFITDNS